MKKIFSWHYLKKFLLALAVMISGSAILYVSAIALEMTTSKYAEAKRVGKLEKSVIVIETHFKYIKGDMAEMKTILKEIRDKK